MTIVGPLPVPVSGSITLAPGSSALPVSVNNAASNPVLVRNVDQTTMEPVQMSTVFTSFNNGGYFSNILTVPAGKRLVIERVSANVNVNGFPLERKLVTADNRSAVTTGLRRR